MALSKTFAGGNGVNTSGTTVSISGLNSTGFTHALVYTKHEGAPTTITPSDNKSSPTWTAETKVDHANGDMSGQWHWVKIGSPGSTHTVTVTLGAARPWLIALVWFVNAPGGVLAKDALAQAQGTSTAIDGGSLATTGASVVSFLAAALYNTFGITPSGGWAEDFDTTAGSVAGWGASRGPETTTPIDPAATWTTNDPWIGAGISLREPSGGTTYNQSAGGTLTFVGLVNKAVFRAISGALSFVGALAQQKSFTKALAGALSFAGALGRAVSRSMSGTLTSSGTLTKATSRSIGGTLTSSGTLKRAVSRSMAGVLSFAGALTANVVIKKALAAGLSFSGTLGTVLSHASSSAARRIRSLGLGLGVWH